MSIRMSAFVACESMFMDSRTNQALKALDFYRKALEEHITRAKQDAQRHAVASADRSSSSLGAQNKYETFFHTVCLCKLFGVFCFCKIQGFYFYYYYFFKFAYVITRHLQQLAQSYMETIIDKDVQMAHMKNVVKMLGSRVQELEALMPAPPAASP